MELPNLKPKGRKPIKEVEFPDQACGGGDKTDKEW
jgi:hypothetical protein